MYKRTTKSFLRFFGLFAIITLSVSSCDEKPVEPTSGPNSPSSNGNKLQDNAYIVDSTFVRGSTDSSLIISKSFNAKVGDVLLGSPSKEAPYGYMRIVKSINDNGTELVITTEQASLVDAFKELHIDATFTDTITSVDSAARKDLNLGEAKLSYKFLNTQFIPGLKLNGVLKMNFSNIQIKYDLEEGAMSPDYFLLRADMNTEGSSFGVTTDKTISYKSGSIAWKEFSLPKFTIPIPIPTPLGLIVIRIPIVQKVVLKSGPIEIGGKVEFLMLPIVNSTIGVEYIGNGLWNDLNTFSLQSKANELNEKKFAPSIAIEAKGTIFKIAYEASPFGAEVIKFASGVPLDLKYKQQVNKSPNYSLSLEAAVDAEFSSTLFWEKNTKELKFEKPFYNLKLLEGDWKRNPWIDTLVGKWSFERYIKFSDANDYQKHVDEYNINKPNNKCAYLWEPIGDNTIKFTDFASIIYEFKEDELSGELTFIGTQETYVSTSHDCNTETHVGSDIWSVSNTGVLSGGTNRSINAQLVRIDDDTYSGVTCTAGCTGRCLVEKCSPMSGYYILKRIK